MKGKFKKLLLSVSGALMATPVALAASAIDNDTLSGLPAVGSDVGNFLKALAPGVGAFIIIMGVFGGIAGIVYAIVGVVKRKIVV